MSDTLNSSRPAMRQALEATLGAWDAVLPAKPKTEAEKLPESPSVILGPRFSEAVAFALAKHGHQTRKGTSVPYFTHLLAVASLVGESGGNEDEVVAGLLHDAVEDGGGAPVLGEIRAQFGEAVADIVNGCTDDDSGSGEKAPWLERKRAYLDHLTSASLSVLRVVAADKLHNARTLERDLKDHGVHIFKRFKGDREGTLWYYRSMARLFGALIQDEGGLDVGFRAMIRDLRETVGRLEG